MKKLVRLTESDLRRIVKESVNRVLIETAYDINSPEYKQMYDKDEPLTDYDIWAAEDKAQTDKEIADYEALPDKARHPYGADIPDFSKRRDSQDTRKYSNYNYGDKLAAKKPNSILKKQEDKAEFQKTLEYSKHNFPFRLWCRRNGLDIESLTDNDRVNIYLDYLDDKREERERRMEFEDY